MCRDIYTRSGFMSRATINFRIDSELKKQMEDICKRLGLNMTSALTVYVTKLVNEQRIPFEILADPFYSQENIKRLGKSIKELEEGKGKIHKLDFDDKIMV